VRKHAAGEEAYTHAGRVTRWQAGQQGCTGGQRPGLLLNQKICSLFIFAHGFLLNAASEKWAAGRFRRSLSDTPISPSVRRQALSETHQILRSHANHAATRAIDIRNQKKRDGHHERCNDKQDRSLFYSARTIPD
jgi:hypothetical protein